MKRSAAAVAPQEAVSPETKKVKVAVEEDLRYAIW
jgi:hypothetical protein